MSEVASSTVDAEVRRIGGLLDAGRVAEAERAARLLWKQAPQRGDVNAALARALINAKRADEGLHYAELAVKAEPGNADYLIALAKLYLRVELLEEAQPLLERALTVEPEGFHTNLSLGTFLFRVGKAESALQYLRHAVAVSPPDAVNATKLKLADCLDSLGLIDEAESLYLELADAKSHGGIGLARAANVRKRNTSSGLFARIEKALASGNVAPDTQMALRNALARMYEGDKNYKTAFAYFSSSKQTAQRSVSVAEFTKMVDESVAVFTAAAIRSMDGYGDPSGLPILVVGMPRSGTTLTEQVIAAHPQGGGAGELQRIALMWKGLAEAHGPAHGLKRLRMLGPEGSRDLAAGYLSLLRFMAPGASRVVDKMPQNFIHIGFAALLFPNMRIVHCMRNPADNFLSAFQNNMNSGHSYSYAPDDYAGYYKQYLRLMRHWRDVLPGRIFDLRYEELTADPETKVKSLLDFLDLPWDERCLRFYERGGSVKTLSRHQVRAPIHSGSVEKWRNYAEQLKPLTEALRAEAAALGYDLDQPRS